MLCSRGRSDSTAGIPPEIQVKIFESFFTTKKMAEGTGLGLDTVYRIIRRLRGSIQVESKTGVIHLSESACP
ncbi:ATP-binding protein [bacterium]|nr:ATP-binding protein [bacterium]